MKPEIVWTPDGCEHGGPLPKEGGRYCMSCQPGGRVVRTELPPVMALPPEYQGDPYDLVQPCASPHAATIVFEGAVQETPHVKRARKQREAT